MAKCTFWYRLTLVVPDEVQRVIKWLYVLAVFGWRGGATVGRPTSGREAVGSIPGRGVAA